MTLLEVRNLTKAFGGIRAVEDCSFSVEQNTITALIGPNGAGKTTVFNMINGLHKPDSGQILFDGEQISGLQPHKVGNALNGQPAFAGNHGVAFDEFMLGGKLD